MSQSKGMYDKEWFNMTLQSLKDAIDDLSAWSAYNDDKNLIEINELKTIAERITL
jgi:hypothetical protein